MNIEFLLQNATTLITTPRDVAKLRQMILTLAVQGKLVPQDPHDEPAEVLLNSILLHKQNLKQSAKSQVAQLPFAIPSNWICVPFGQIMINRDGERIPVSKEERDTRAKIYDYYGASGVIDKIDNYLFDKPLLLISEDGANLINRSTPIAFIARGKYWVNNHAHVLDAYNEDLLRYIEIHINSIDLKPYVTGTAQPKMNQQKMNTIPVPLPPLAEQRRIVARVDELMAICDTLEAQLQARAHMQQRVVQAALARVQADPSPASIATLLDPKIGASPADLRQMILTLAVQGKLVPQEAGDEPAEVLLRKMNIKPLPTVTTYPISLPHNWVWISPSQLGKISGGMTPSKAKTDYWSQGTINWYSSKDIKSDELYESELKISESAYQDTGLKLYPPGCLIFVTRSGILKHTFPVSINRTPATVNQDLKVLHPTISGMERYLQIMFKGLNNFIISDLVKTGMTVQSLMFDEFCTQPFPLPPLAEQRRIVARVDKLMALVDRLEAQQTQASTLGAQVLDVLVGQSS